MIMGEDVVETSGGPSWIFTSMKYIDNDTKTTLTVRSISMKTSTDYWIKASAGFHYCKVLSPARAIEWIYVDSLRAHYRI